MVRITSWGANARAAGLTLRQSLGLELSQLRPILESIPPFDLEAVDWGSARTCADMLLSAGAEAFVVVEGGHNVHDELPSLLLVSNEMCTEIPTSGLAPKQSWVIRLRRWWSANDRDRSETDVDVPSWWGTGQTKYAEAIVEHLAADADWHFRAEALRELGLFDAAIREVGARDGRLAKRIVNLAAENRAAVETYVPGPR